jgi:hypothetical protein
VLHLDVSELRQPKFVWTAVACAWITMPRMLRIIFCLATSLIVLATCSVVFADPGDRAEGLILQAYKANRVMRQMRDPLPGILPDKVAVTHSLELQVADDFAGFDEMFQVVVHGDLSIETAGTYVFSIDADDGADLSINGQLVATDFWKPGPGEFATATLDLPTGRHAIRVRMAEGDGGQGLFVRWKPPGAGEFVAIPASVLSHEPGKKLAATQPAAVSPELARHHFIYATRGFASLKDAQAELLVNLLEGPTTLSESAREDLATFLEEVRFSKLEYWNQTKVLTGFAGGWYAGSTRRRPVESRVSFSVSPAIAERYDYWRGAMHDGFKQTVTISGHDVLLFTPTQDAVERSSVPEALAGLPSRYLRLVRTVRVAPYGTASEFNGGGSQIFVRLKREASTGTLDASFAHEAGHLFQHQFGMYNQWVDASNADLLSLSEYGRRNPTEDFAEFNRLYISTNDSPAEIESLRKLFPARMKIYEEMIRKLDERNAANAKDVQ